MIARHISVHTHADVNVITQFQMPSLWQSRPLEHLASCVQNLWRHGRVTVHTTEESPQVRVCHVLNNTCGTCKLIHRSRRDNSARRRSALTEFTCRRTLKAASNAMSFFAIRLLISPLRRHCRAACWRPLKSVPVEQTRRIKECP